MGSRKKGVVLLCMAAVALTICANYFRNASFARVSTTTTTVELQVEVEEPITSLQRPKNDALPKIEQKPAIRLDAQQKLQSMPVHVLPQPSYAAPLITTPPTSLAHTSPAPTAAPVRNKTPYHRKDYNFCHINPEPEKGKSRVLVPELEDMPLYYQCNGQPYQDFMKIMVQLIKKKHYAEPDSQWGRRPMLVPRNNTKILVMGNSHTRQVMSTLLCHYKDSILHSEQVAEVPGKKNVAMKFELKGDITIYIIINHPFVYSKRWQLTLSVDLLKMPLTSLDAIVLGSFNELHQSQKTNFLETTLRYQKEVPRHRVEFENQKPPYVEDVAKVFDGPLVWMSMFARYNEDYHKNATRMIHDLRYRPEEERVGDRRPIKQYHLTKRTNLRAVYGRNYIEEMGAECSSDKYDTVGTCKTNRASKRYSDGHRCVGPIGGQPDLIAWDLVEALWDLLEEQEKENEGD